MALTPSNGSMYYPPGGDYTAAKYGNFTYQIVLQDLSETQAAYVHTLLSDVSFLQYIAKIYEGRY